MELAGLSRANGTQKTARATLAPGGDRLCWAYQDRPKFVWL